MISPDTKMLDSITITAMDRDTHCASDTLTWQSLHLSHDIPNLVLSSGLGELEVHTLARQPLVHLGVGVEAVVNTTTLLLVEDDLEDLAAVLTGTGALADNLDGVDQVLENGVVNGGERPRTGTLLGLSGAATVRALGAGKNAARGNDQDVAVRELLLELAGQAA